MSNTSFCAKVKDRLKIKTRENNAFMGRKN
jgi:hypothetical protein